MKKGIGEAHAKLILMGEHSVVYGKLSIGIPFIATKVEVTLAETSNDSYMYSSMYAGKLDRIPYYLENIYATYQKLKSDLKITSNLDLTIKSTIPVERGLGSSAAVATALVRAFEDLVGEHFDTDKFLEYVDLSEKICHGNPSGLDARLVTLEQPLLFQKHQKIENFYFDTPYYLLVVDTGITGQTKEAVNDVRENYESPYYARSQACKYHIEKLDDLAHQFHQVLMANNTSYQELAQIIDSAHDSLRALQVSSPEQDYGISFAKEHGAGSGKITGGGRGGCFYVLCETKEIAETLKQLMLTSRTGVEAWTVRLSSIDFGNFQNPKCSNL